MVEESVDRAFNKLIIDMDVTIQSTLVTECIRILTKGKACGPDGITHEHLLYFCSVISTPLAGFYTHTIRSGYTVRTQYNDTVGSKKVCQHIEFSSILNFYNSP